MTALIRVTLSCDQCGSFLDRWSTSVTRVRVFARTVGWRRSKGRDICSHHPVGRKT